MTLHSTINNSKYYDSDEDDAESDPKSDPLVATHTIDRKKRKATDIYTTNGNSPQKLFVNWTIPVIISLINLPIDDGVALVEVLCMCARQLL